MRHLIFASFLGFTQIAFAQSPIIDSLNNLLKNHQKEDSIRVALLNEISLRIFKNQPEKSLDFANQALSLAQTLRFQPGVGEAKNNLAIYHLMKGSADVALEEAFEATKIGEQNHRPELLANSYANLGNIYNNQLNYPKARYY